MIVIGTALVEQYFAQRAGHMRASILEGGRVVFNIMETV